uniref:Late embryogenesis abundant protein 1-like n=1 Tax=Cucumis melo TaxID=3656 RepID=A0A9I9DSD0_CUCME
MASHQDNLSHKAGETVGQAQVKKDEMMNQPTAHDQSATQTASDLKDQAANFLQQTGEQVKNMAQGAAEAVKNTLGMNTDNTSNPNSNNPTNNPTTNPSNNPTTNPSNNPTNNPSTRI